MTSVEARYAGFEAKFGAIKAPKKYAAFRKATLADMNVINGHTATFAAAVTPTSSRGSVNAAQASYALRLRAGGEEHGQALRLAGPAALRHASSEPPLDSVLVEALREHLEHPAGRGKRPDGAHDGSAGGAACGDLIRISLRIDGDRVAAAGFEASGCGTMTAAGSAAVTLAGGATVLDAARVGAHAIAAELGGLSPGKFHAADLAADALHRALGLRRPRQARLKPDPGRTLVAMSGGVDSAVAALLAGEDAAAVTLELWATRPTTPRRRAARPTRSGSPARSRTAWGCRTSRSTCARSSAPAWWTRSWPATRRA